MFERLNERISQPKLSDDPWLFDAYIDFTQEEFADETPLHQQLKLRKSLTSAWNN